VWKPAENRTIGDRNCSCGRDRVSLDVLLGRGLAFCVHPCAAWGRLTAGGRALLVFAYFGAGYGAVLALLLAR
jgi:hypothetical protein